MSLSPAGEDPSPDEDEAAPEDADLEYSDDDDARLLVRDTVVADPRLDVLDGPAVDDAEPEGERSSSASSRLGRREPKLRRCCVAAAERPRPVMEVRIQRVALKESRKRTLLTAVRRVPRRDAGRFSVSGSMIGSMLCSRTRLSLVPRFW